MTRQMLLFGVIVISLVILFLSGCNSPSSPVMILSGPTALSTPVLRTPRAIPTVLEITPPIPVISPTPKDTLIIHQTKIEVVTENAATGDGGNSWGGHQTRIVRTEAGVFTAYTVEGDGYFNREWRLAERQPDGTWIIISQGKSGREPVNLLASPDGTLNIIGWPDGVATIWSGKPRDGTLIMTSSQIPIELVENWPYNSAGIDANGNICVLSSEGGEEPGGNFYLACYLLSEARWVTQISNLDYRYSYTYLFPSSNGGLSLVSTRDVRWSALGYQQPEGEFDYVFNAFGIWQTDNFSESQLERVYIKEETPTKQFPAVRLDAQQDAYVDTKGQIHVIYEARGESTNGKWISRHAIFLPDGSLIYDVPLPKAAGDYSRIFQDQEGRFYLLGSSGYLYSMGLDGLKVGKRIKLDLESYQVEYSGFGISVPRTGTPISNVVDIVFPSANGAKWVYFQLDFSTK